MPSLVAVSKLFSQSEVHRSIMSVKHQNNSWIYVPNYLKDTIEQDIRKMTLPQLKAMLRDYKKDNPEVFLTGTKNVLTDQVLRILNQNHHLTMSAPTKSNMNSTTSAASGML